ncbi:carbonate dehydratase [Acuticoccus yangtzensis]|uniref:carbonate dehydratase n=1 Tax=Acuticoccus yangtzensis TaxID=1443441 RepID=UPI0009496E4A|nr:carbonate dehydratase [Acuticoccus yangtzensis]ORE95290.1 carbonic anhydrase [Stappia sp. 22II-S9-Z10]
MNDIDKLCERNQAWADRVTDEDPEFFKRLSLQQTPDWFWIGCSDSRVPANQLMDLPPGEVFVHRNIANVVSPSDLNFLSVLQYAVEVLRVKHVIVCGHYGCGGIRASESDKDHGLIDNWLNHIRLVKRLHSEELEGLTGDKRFDRLCELNVVEQVRNVAHTTIVRNAWARGQGLLLHGVVYSLATGVLNRVVQRSSENDVQVFQV